MKYDLALPEDKYKLETLLKLNKDKVVEVSIVRFKRTLTQNSAMHLFFKMLADYLNDSGLDMRKVLKPEYNMSWNELNVKEHLWKPIQNGLFNIDSTTKLKTNQVSEVHETLMKNLCEKFGLEFIPFPSYQDLIIRSDNENKRS